jgi:glycosyltransferase involved in cell wall biosynthesis
MSNENSNMLVSVCIPCYNQPQFIKQAVESVLMQSYENIEIIISDDSENDDTKKVIESCSFPKIVKYYKNSFNIGRVKNYRKLLYELSNGKYVLMLDGDDFLLDFNFISIAVNRFISNPDIILVAGGISKFDTIENKNEIYKISDNENIFDGKLVFEEPQFLACHQASIYIRDLAIALNFYNYESMGSDSESLFRYYLFGKVLYLNNIVSCWRIHKENTTYSRDINLQIKELDFINSIYNFSTSYISTKILKKWRNFIYYQMLQHILYLMKNYNKISRINILFKHFRFLGYYYFLILLTNTLLKKNENI